MEAEILKAILIKSDWLIVSIFVIYLAFKIIMYILENRKAKTKEETLNSEFKIIKDKIEVIEVMATNSAVKDRIIDSINNKLKVIYAQYGSELSKELAMIIIQNFYFGFAQHVANEIYDLQKKNYSHKKIIGSIKTVLSILNDEKIQELDGFMYREKSLVTFIPGTIIEESKIMNVIDTHIDMNGMLRKEIENLLSIESSNVIKRF